MLPVKVPSQGFEWCFKPYIFILKLLSGTPVDRSTSSNCFAFYGSILLLINAAINIEYTRENIVRNFVRYDENNSLIPRHIETNKTLSDVVSMGINVGNEVFLVFGTHFSFFLITYASSSSKRLWNCFLEIERQLKVSSQSYRRIRNMVVFSLFLLILVNIVYNTIHAEIPIIN